MCLTVMALWILWLVAVVVADESPKSNICKEVSFDVEGTALNKNLTGVLFDPSTLASDVLLNIWNDAEDIEISGTQTLRGTFCMPTKGNANNNKIQVLFHGITDTRSAWQALGGIGTDFEPYRPEKYSWVEYANAQGYPVLNMDRLGNGRSAHPDPILVVQAPYEMAIYADLAKQIRTGNSQLPQRYDHLIWIGNSYGSQLGAGVAGAYPEAYTEYILTGFTKSPLKGLAGAGFTLAAPAQAVDPTRFGTLPSGYLTTASKEGRKNTFFGSKAQVDFEDIIARLFFDRKDVVSLGQFLSVYGLSFHSGIFSRRVFNLIGENDQPFCGPGSPVLGPAFCGPQTEATGSQFPNAEYNWRSVDRIGHTVQLHTRSQKLFQIAHRFLGGEIFTGGPPI